MTDLNAIKARLGSISPKTMASLPKAVQTLLKEDFPLLVSLAEATKEVHCKREQGPEDFPTDMAKNWPVMIGVLEQLFPSPEQQIEDMPW